MADKLTFDFTWASKQNYGKYEFGVPWWRECLWHKISDDEYALSYSGSRIYECHKDGSAYICFNNLTSGVKNRWLNVTASNLDIETQRVSKANGITTYRVTVKQREHYKLDNGRESYRFKKIGTVSAHTRIKIWDGTQFVCEVADPVTKVATKDNTKYREFNAQLKKLRAVLSGQAKMGVYDKFAERWSSVLNDELTRIMGGKTHLYYSDTGNRMYDAALQWMETGDAELTKVIALCALRNHHSETSAKANLAENIRRRLMNGLKAVQTRYLREHCVTISHSNNSLSPSDESDDQDSVLQPPAGLREVQVPCQAEVC